MNRILSLVTLAGMATVLAGTLAASQLHGSAHAAPKAQVAAGAACTDPARCPVGSCPVRPSAAATFGSAGTAGKAATPGKGGACPNPATCGGACPLNGAATSLAVAEK